MQTEQQNAHESLFSGTPLKLGLTHWYLLRAAIEIEKRRSGKAGGKYESTEFGTEVGGDEINWWIHRKESAISELYNRTTDTLSHAQQLKDDATALKTASPSTYAELISTLRAFAEAHATQITNLYEYVTWLHTKDTLGPSILFTYRVWGSTRRSERWVELSADSPDNENPMAMKKIMEMVFGLRGFVLYRIDKVEFDIIGDLATFDPEDPAYSESLIVPENVLIARTAYETFGGLLEYFAMIRDSLRNVLLDIQKRLEPERLRGNDVFWRKFIVKAKDSKQTEEQLWDFKQTLEMWHTREIKSKNDAKKAFAEQVAAFANAHGGVIIVGVTDKPPRTIIGIEGQLEERLKFTGDVIQEYIQYPRAIVDLHQVEICDGDFTSQTCLLIVVARSCDVVSVKDDRGSYTYPKRVQTGLRRVDPETISREKLQFKKDSYDFIANLAQFVYDQ